MHIYTLATKNILKGRCEGFLKLQLAFACKACTSYRRGEERSHLPHQTKMILPRATFHNHLHKY